MSQGPTLEQVLLELVDEMVDNWHTRLEDGQKLHEYLGMSWEEYGRWVKDPTGWASGEGAAWFSSRHLRESVAR